MSAKGMQGGIREHSQFLQTDQDELQFLKQPTGALFINLPSSSTHVHSLAFFFYRESDPNFRQKSFSLKRSICGQ
jgi:hypothetical protein